MYKRQALETIKCFEARYNMSDFSIMLWRHVYAVAACKEKLGKVMGCFGSDNFSFGSSFFVGYKRISISYYSEL